MKVFLSVIIPVYNESIRLQNIEEVVNYLKKQPYKSEIIVVNDGSTDDTRHKLKSYNTIVKIISYKKNKGKGFAIKKGMLEATGDYRLFTDVDLSVAISHIKKFMNHKDSYDIVIASRRVSGTKVAIHQPVLREFMGSFFTKLSQYVLGVKIKDFTCGFKLFQKKAAVEIFSHTHINRWGFDSEALFLAKKYKFSIKEMPVIWEHNTHTKVRFPQDVVRSFLELLMIHKNNFQKKY